MLCSYLPGSFCFLYVCVSSLVRDLAMSFLVAVQRVVCVCVCVFVFYGCSYVCVWLLMYIVRPSVVS